MPQQSAGVSPDLNDVVDGVLRASRALVAVSARSIAKVDDAVTMPQYRALVTLAALGPKNVGTLADELGVHASTATRLCDRLVRTGLIDREPSTISRREVIVRLTVKGRRLVGRVTRARRQAIEEIVGRVPESSRLALVDALQAFSDAAGEVPDDAWYDGWAGS